MLYIQVQCKYNIQPILGWVVPVKDTYYPLNGNTFYFTTESVTGGSDKVKFSGGWITMWWWFTDWKFEIINCTHFGNPLTFPVTPPTGVRKTWEVTLTPEDVVIKCNAVEVLHFVFDIRHDSSCTLVKGHKAIQVLFSGDDTATRMFTSEQVGK